MVECRKVGFQLYLKYGSGYIESDWDDQPHPGVEITDGTPPSDHNDYQFLATMSGNPLSSFSTNHEDAWQLLESLRTDFEVRIYSPNWESPERWEVDFIHKTTRKTFTAKSTSVESAISKAAYRARRAYPV